MNGVLDPYALGCVLHGLGNSWCQHRTIRAVSWHPGLKIAQFSNPEGLVLPLVLDPAKVEAFTACLPYATSEAFGELHGHGRFALRGDYVEELAAIGQLEEFVTYYFGPDPAGVQFMQQAGPRLDCGETREQWEETCRRLDAIRPWLAGEPLNRQHGRATA
ncbi:hypothetical protein R5R73_02720 [Salinicola sp. LHM]|uniref:hypothetical protein n=1 Tax=Salinicola sp. LHM TaxID=3065298 RepID=UPI002ACD2028|nr:hypothetical protein [Salinicola sp. LHM]WQH33609.1 hypothetical protein R5R73_02720 [Salinicola sp. LHM]|tara:strand:- start:64 stop:546 length:483 start_codon:yes stop_codon:yes gene_type:complete